MSDKKWQLLTIDKNRKNERYACWCCTSSKFVTYYVALQGPSPLNGITVGQGFYICYFCILMESDFHSDKEPYIVWARNNEKMPSYIFKEIQERVEQYDKKL